MALPDIIDQILGTDTSREIQSYKELFSGLEDAGLITPDYQELSGTAFEDILVDPQSRDAQVKALELISDLADDGMTAQDEAILGQITRQQNAQDRMNREAINQAFARRGALGSGANLANQMLAQQSGAEMAALRGLEAAGQASARRQGAIGQMAGQASGLRGQDYGQAAQKAQAQDLINRFNTDTRNRGMDMANQLRQQDYDNRLRQAQSQSGAYQMAVQDKAQKRDAIMGAGGSALQTGGQMAGQAAMMFSDINLKENIVDGSSDVQKFLNELPQYKYNYTDNSHGEGTYVSPMAQDLEQTELGKDLVINTSEGKMVDYGKALGLMLSSLSNISQRLERAGL